jgi:hypothetical protein
MSSLEHTLVDALENLCLKYWHTSNGDLTNDREYQLALRAIEKAKGLVPMELSQ